MLSTMRSTWSKKSTVVGQVRCKSSKSWVPSSADQLEKAIVNSLVHNVSQNSLQVVQDVVPWYLKMMPAQYFQEEAESTRTEHLKGLMALRSIEAADDLSLTLASKDDFQRTEFTILRNNGRPGTLNKMFKSFTASDQPGMLERVRAYQSGDGSFTLNIFTYGIKQESDIRATVEDGKAHMGKLVDSEARESLADYLACCLPQYALQTPPDRFQRHRKFYDAVKGTDRVEVRIYPSDEESERMWVAIAAPNATAESLLVHVTALCFLRGLNIQRLKMDMIRDPTNPIGDLPGAVCLVRILTSESDASALPENAVPFQDAFTDANNDTWKAVKRDLRRIKWLDNATLDLAMNKMPCLGLQRAEIITALCAMLHGPLSKSNPLTFSRQNMHDLMCNPWYTTFFFDIADLFIARFNPAGPLANQEFVSQCESLRSRVSALTNESPRLLLQKMIDAVQLTLRTNLFMPSRYALALRVHPSLMVSPGQEMPFGVLFVHGQSFDGFHNRFQNIARGGLRLVSPISAEQHAMESSRCYDEVYGLSHAQQLKNKDIPEGGSKAVCLVNLSQVSNSQRYNTLRNSVKGFTDAVLDLIVSSEETRDHVVDHLGFDELLYLGPDEQIIPEDINWIIRQAAKRGYPIPAAFMSSKPLAGINHKEYGVTSEGVAVFLDVALRNKGINPSKDEFTVKITGGPDGDVAGNLMRILIRDYGRNVKIVGVADGSGCAEDPAGLSHDELTRLFRAASPIANLSTETLSQNGVIHLANTEEGIRMRNSMLNRVQSDVFVPGGGRPNTIHAGNWKEFLDLETGRPSSPIIVEGANIFVTAEARDALHQHGVTIIKDSSANKCGVITSSYEICASMLLEEDEFLEIKESLICDVLQRLRDLARLEAEVLFREYDNYPGALPGFSERISHAINRAQVQIWEDLAGMQKGDETYKELLPIFYEHLPRKLAQVAGERVEERIPLDYLRSAFSSCLASKLLYREGLHFLEAQPRERLFDLARKYFHEEKRINELVDLVQRESNLPDAETCEVTKLLTRGGVRSSLGVY